MNLRQISFVVFMLVACTVALSGCSFSFVLPPSTEDAGPTPRSDSGHDPLADDAGAVLPDPPPSGECEIGDTRYCYSGLPGTDGVGQCHGSTRYCVEAPDGSGQWDISCVGEVTPWPWGDVPSDGIDNDCDGYIDEDQVARTEDPRGDIRMGEPSSDVSVGNLSARVASFSFTANNATLCLDRIALTQSGTATAANFVNPTSLLSGAVRLPTSWDEAGRLVIDPIREPGRGSGACIGEGGTMEISVYAEIQGPSERSFDFHVGSYADVVVVDITHFDDERPAAACISPLHIDGCTAEGQGSYDGSLPGTSSSAWIR